jgi:hypothetical protein
VLYQQNFKGGARRVVHRFSGGRWCGLSLDPSGHFLLIASSVRQDTAVLARLDTLTGQLTHLSAIPKMGSGEPPTW